MEKEEEYESALTWDATRIDQLEDGLEVKQVRRTKTAATAMTILLGELGMTFHIKWFLMNSYNLKLCLLSFSFVSAEYSVPMHWERVAAVGYICVWLQTGDDEGRLRTAWDGGNWIGSCAHLPDPMHPKRGFMRQVRQIASWSSLLNSATCSGANIWICSSCQNVQFPLKNRFIQEGCMRIDWNLITKKAIYFYARLRMNIIPVYPMLAVSISVWPACSFRD